MARKRGKHSKATRMQDFAVGILAGTISSALADLIVEVIKHILGW